MSGLLSIDFGTWHLFVFGDKSNGSLMRYRQDAECCEERRSVLPLSRGECAKRRASSAIYQSPKVKIERSGVSGWPQKERKEKNDERKKERKKNSAASLKLGAR